MDTTNTSKKLKDTTVLLLEEIRIYLKKHGCSDSKIAALHVVKMVYDDLILSHKLQEETE